MFLYEHTKMIKLYYKLKSKMGGKSPNQVRKVNHFFFGDVVKKKSFNKDVICVTKPIMSK
jgi:hypothetical protein